MENVIRQCIGIDCGMKEHVASFSRMYVDLRVECLSTLAIPNGPGGFVKLSKWIRKLIDPSMPCQIVLEATGVYHETLACFLTEKGWPVSVVLPNRAKYFSKTLTVKTVNDKVSSQTLAAMGLEKKLDVWSPPDPIYNQLRQLTRERDQLKAESTQIKCQLHAEESGAWPNKSSIKRMNQRLSLIERQVEEVETSIREVVAESPEIDQAVRRMTSIVGVGMLTAVTVLAETNGFNLVRNKKQLVSYAGLDVVERTSGISVRGRSRISHRGNRYLRKCLYFPAMTAARHSNDHKALYNRLISKHGIAMKAAVAVQRKLLVMMYAIWKNGTIYDPNYESKKQQNELGQTRRPALTELA